MNIVVVGAGAIGSLFGAFLSQHNNVVLLGRTPHVTAVRQHGLSIGGHTTVRVTLHAVDTIQEIHCCPDLLLLTVKSYDTATAIRQVQPLLSDTSVVLSLQNGLDNIEKITHVIDERQVLAGITTHGAHFSTPGHVEHTGCGETLIGELNGTESPRLKTIVQMFTHAGIPTQPSNEIQRELWVKAIINSSINPLTAFFQCPNGYLLHNPLLEETVTRVCEESTRVAIANGMRLTTADMIQRTKKVIRDTAENTSSMLQSVQQGKQTEIASINGRLIAVGKQYGVQTPLNDILLHLITTLNTSPMG